MKNDVGYLEHGEMIRLGTIIKMVNRDARVGDVYYIVSKFESYPVINSFGTGETGERSFMVNLEPINGYRDAAADFTRSELQDMLTDKLIAIYN